jgi:hypothetical protein
MVAKKYGVHKHPLYGTWRNALNRCRWKKHPQYKDYGGRGITMHEEWANSFQAFVRDVPPKPSPRHQLDRKDNSLGYVPGNVRWATKLEQANNTRTNVFLEINGRRQTLRQWERELELRPGQLWERLKRGTPLHRAVQNLDLRRHPARLPSGAPKSAET